MAAPDALVNACALWTMTARSSDADVRGLGLVESEACIAMLRRP
jgi:hypothetical protein